MQYAENTAGPNKEYLTLPAEDIRAEKKSIRIKAELIRSENMPYMQEYSQSISARLFELDAVKNADAILSFVSFRSEVSTEPIHRECKKRDIPLYLPVCEGKEMLFFRGDRGQLSPGAYGIPEPEKTDPIDFLTVFRPVILVPGLVFNRRGYRLGYGGGYYDRYLSEWSSRLYSIGIAYHNQLNDGIPIDTCDRRVQAIVTEQETILTRG